MTRFLAILLVILLLWWLLERALKAFRRSPTGRQMSALYRVLQGLGGGAASRPPATKSSTQRREPGTLIRCSVCGTHVLEASCVHVSRDRRVVHCSQRCRRQAAGGGD